MAENFRNKQWFKKLSQDRKDEICKKFDIDEKTLKKCGRETEDGRIVIDVLRIDHLIHYPETWDEYRKYLTDDDLFNNELCWEFNNITDKLIRINHIWNCFTNNKSLNKYKQNLHNDLLVEQSYKNVVYWVEQAKENIDDKEQFSFCCYQICINIKCLLESDLNIVKK